MNEREFKTTFFEDFSIADKFWIKAIRDTYQRAFTEWKNNVKYFTEFVVALNWKIWERYEKDQDVAKVYNELRIEADEFANENFKWNDLDYFYRLTD